MSTRRTRKTATPEQYERAMSYKGQRSAAVVERLVGVNQSTIRRWWKGTRPKFMYTAAQKRGEYFIPEQHPLPEEERRRRILETKRRNNRKHGRKYMLRHRGIYHPVLNPDPGLIPLHRLWLPGPAVRDFILERYTETQVNQRLKGLGKGKESGEYRRWNDVQAGKPWIRYDAADRLFIALRLVLAEMAVEPIQSSLVPKEAPCSSVSRAA